MKDLTAIFMAFIPFSTCVVSGTYLALNNHYGYAWVPFLLATCIKINLNVDDKKSPTADDGGKV